MEKDKKMNFKPIKLGEKPFEGAYEGEERHFGLPNKVFKVYLEGEGDDGEKAFIPVQMITPKARKLTKFISNASVVLSALENGDFSSVDDGALDDFIELTQELFQIAESVVDKLTFMSIVQMVAFATNIAVNPRSGDKK